MKKLLIDQNPEEGIIKNEELTKHDYVEFSKLSKFPYCLVGKITSEFKEEKLCKSGVGILIGPSIVLTAGHNLTNINKETGLPTIVDSINFCLGINGDFEPFETLKTSDFFIPEDFLNGIKEQNAKKQLLNDWAIIYLKSPIGESVKNLYSLQKFSYLQVRENGLFAYFTDNATQNLSKLMGINPEISIIGYCWNNEDLDNLKEEQKFGTTTPSSIAYQENDKMNIREFGTTSEAAKKDININIQISTLEEGFVKSSLVDTNKSFSNYNMKINKQSIQTASSQTVTNLRKKSLDYVILSNSCTNSKVENLKDKLISKNSEEEKKLLMSESHGKLEDCQEALKYKISTYKGQSGSPIFLKLRKIGGNENERLSNKKTEINIEKSNPFVENVNIYSNDLANSDSEFIYIFIGIHSRRGPLLYDSLMLKEIDDENHAYFGLDSRVDLLGDDNELDKVETSVKRMKSMSICSRNIPKNSENKPNDLDDFTNMIMTHGVCEFNEGLLIMGNKVNPICLAAGKTDTLKAVQSVSTTAPRIDNFKATSYKSISLTLSGKEKILGLFHKDSKFETLFEFGASILNIDINYVILNLIKNKHEKKFNSKYDNTKRLGQVLDDEQFTAVFEVDINMKYGDELGKKVLDKYLENYDVEMSEIKEEFKEKHMKTLFDSIFDEIGMFIEIPPLYGKLFNKIRSYIVNKLEL